LNILTIDKVTKTYSSKIAINEVSLTIPKGCIYGLLGPNGAGKTTLIRMITHITLPDSGKILFEDQPLTEAHQQLMGYMPEERGLYKKMTVGEQLEYLMELRGLKSKDAKYRIESWLERFDLSAWKKRKVEELSKGMQQKVQFILTVAHMPPLLILDEPASGLDPVNAKLIEETLKQLAKQGTTIIFSTHRMEQVEELCDRLCLINNGQIMLADEIEEIRKKYYRNEYIIEAEAIPETVALPDGIEIIEKNSRQLMVRLSANVSAQPLIGALNAQMKMTHFQLRLPSIRDIFIDIVQQKQPA
jgi:ABC-2 type transport system ATP-binding protein